MTPAYLKYAYGGKQRGIKRPLDEGDNFMAAITICSDFGAQENKVCHCFHCFPICLP